MRFSTSEIKSKASEKVHNARNAFTDWESFKNWVQVPDTALDQYVALFIVAVDKARRI